MSEKERERMSSGFVRTTTKHFDECHDLNSVNLLMATGDGGGIYS
jgi:hypothetical protein